MIGLFFLSGGKIIEVSNNNTAEQAIKQFFDFKVLHCTILKDYDITLGKDSLHTETLMAVFERFLSSSGYNATDCIDYDKSYTYMHTCDLGNGDGEKPYPFICIIKKNWLQTYKDSRIRPGIKAPETFKTKYTNKPIGLPDPPPLDFILPGSYFTTIYRPS